MKTMSSVKVKNKGRKVIKTQSFCAHYNVVQCAGCSIVLSLLAQLYSTSFTHRLLFLAARFDAKTIFFPSGDQVGQEFSDSSVKRMGSVSDKEIIQISLFPLRSDMKAILLPSGDQAGVEQPPRPLASLTGASLPTDCTKRPLSLESTSDRQ